MVSAESGMTSDIILAGTTSTNKAKLVLSVLSPLDNKIMQALADTDLCANLVISNYGK